MTETIAAHSNAINVHDVRFSYDDRTVLSLDHYSLRAGGQTAVIGHRA